MRDFRPEVGKDSLLKKRTRHSPEQIIAKLRDAELRLGRGESLAHVLQTLAVSEQTYYRWKKQFSGMKAPDAKRLKELEKENERLRKAVSDLTLEKLILREAASGNF